MPGDKEEPDQHDARFAPGLSDAQRAEAERILDALRDTHRERQQRAEDGTASGDPALMLPMCPTLLANGEPCLLPTLDGQSCSHRDPGPAPEALARVVLELRQDVAEARQVAATLGAALRYLRGDNGVEAVLRREQPWWLMPGEWPPSQLGGWYPGMPPRAPQ